MNFYENKKYMVRAEGKKELTFNFPLEAGETPAGGTEAILGYGPNPT